MSSQKRKKPQKTDTPKASILSYFSQSNNKIKPFSDKNAKVDAKLQQNTNNNINESKKLVENLLPSSRQLEEPAFGVITISSDDEDFENTSNQSPKKRKKSLRSSSKRIKGCQPSTHHRNHDSKKHVSTLESNLMTVSSTNVDIYKLNKDKCAMLDLEVNAKNVEKVHSFFQKQTKVEKGADSSKLQNVVSQNKNHSRTDCATANNKETKIPTPQSSKTEVPQEKIAYYLLNFKQILDTVMGNDDDRSLFEDTDDIVWLDKFSALPITEQKLYVRLYHRKLAWLRLGQVSYPDIADDILAVLKNLTKEGFLITFDEKKMCDIELKDVLKMLPAPSLRELAKSFHVNVNGRQKGQMISDLEKMCSKQRSVIGEFFNKKPQSEGVANHARSGLGRTVMGRACKYLGPCYKVASYPRTVCNRVLLVFDVTRGIDDETECSLTGSQNAAGPGRHLQLSAILMAGMGKVMYPTCEVNRPTPIFRQRSDLLHYETAFQFQTDILSYVEAGKWEEASALCTAANNVRVSLETDDKLSCERSRTLPIFLRCFTAQWTYTRLRSLEVEILQRLKKYDKAVKILRELLDQSIYCTSRRGHWWERLALNMDQHLKDPSGSLEVIHNSLNDKDVRVGHKLALAQRVNKILTSRVAKSKTSELTKIYEEKLQPMMDRLKIEEPPVVEITGRLLPSEMQTGKSRFIATEFDGESTASTLLCSVEELALSHYRSLDYNLGIHGEGGTFSTLFCLFLWDIIFMPGIPDVFRTSYQTHPLDYHTDEFYWSRKEDIEKRLQLVSDLGKEEEPAARGESLEEDVLDVLDNLSALDLMTMTWNVEYGKSCAGMDWTRFSSLEEAKGFVTCIGGKVLSGIFRRLAKDLRHTRSGMPDLVVWNPDDRIYKMVEVKGPGDRLSTNQKLWIDELIRLNANVEVCKVVAVGGKMLSKE